MRFPCNLQTKCMDSFKHHRSLREHADNAFCRQFQLHVDSQLLLFSLFSQSEFYFDLHLHLDFLFFLILNDDVDCICLLLCLF